jgi:hypothetical protein
MRFVFLKHSERIRPVHRRYYIMMLNPQFIAWQLITDKETKVTRKVPVSHITGYAIDPHNPENWMTEADARAALKPGMQLGYVFTEADPYFFIDLDHCKLPNNEWSKLAQEICEMFPGAYIEISQSGEGLHIIGAANAIPPHACKNTELHIELYHTRRFIALTGTSAQGEADADYTDALAALVTKYFLPSKSADAPDDWTDTPCDEWAGYTDDAELIASARASRSTASAFGTKASFEALWTADPKALRRAFPPQSEGQTYDASSADAALAMHLAYWTGRDCARMDRLMRQSALVREKWARADYLPNTIRKAARGARDVHKRAAMAKPQPNTENAPAGDPDGWPVPQPLAVKVEPAPYPLDALPPTIRAAVEEVAGFVKAPLPLVASSALAALSLAIQAHVDAKRAEKLTGPVGLFLLTIADSGERKSTCDGFFTKSIRDYETEQAEVAKPILKKYQAALDAWEAKRGGVKDKIRQLAKENKPTAGMESTLYDLEHAKPQAPRIPRLIYADATPEALAYELATKWPSAGVISAEAGSVFGSHGMGKDSVMRNLATLNQLWDGTSLTVDRRTSESFTVKGARLTVALQVQEPTLREFFDKTGALARGTGFLARFLVAWPQSTQGFRPFTEAPENWPHLATFNRRIAAILAQPVPIDDDGALTPAMLMLTPEAKAAWVAFHDAIEGELASGGELYDVRDVASKSADNAVRLATLFQVFEGAGGAIGAEAFESASRIATWHLNESRRFFGELALPVELANAARLDTWLIEYCRREHTHLVPIAKLQQGGPGGLRDKAAIEAAMRELEESGRARFVRDGKRKMISVNPALLR